MKSENKDTAYEHKSITVKKRIRTIKKESPGSTKGDLYCKHKGLGVQTLENYTVLQTLGNCITNIANIRELYSKH